MEEPPAKRAKGARGATVMPNDNLFEHLPQENRIETRGLVVTGHNPDGKGKVVQVIVPRNPHTGKKGKLSGFKSEKKKKPGVGNEKVDLWFVDVSGDEGKFLGLRDRDFTYMPDYVGRHTPYDVGALMVVQERGAVQFCTVEGVYAYGEKIEYSVRIVVLKEVDGKDTIVGTEHREKKMHNQLFKPFCPGQEPWKPESEREHIEIPEVRLNTYVKIESPGTLHHHKTGLVTKFTKHDMCKVLVGPGIVETVHHYYLRFVS